MSKLQIILLPEVAEVYDVEANVENQIIGIAGIAGEIDLTTLSLARAKVLFSLGLSKVLKLKKEEKQIEKK
ncbi:hypothetical protein [Emticicia sp.]|uniref:hypothetical protein n=1 Tax=Emticicia sp. TaxID=1930953 RepID=UPI003750B36B